MQEEAAPNVNENIEAMARLVRDEENSMTGHQRIIERLVTALSVPAFAYGVGVAIAVWVGFNLVLRYEGHRPWDAPPFPELQTAVSVFALLMTSVVVVTQARQGRVADRNAHLDLQLSLLVDQKVTKIIELLEEIRVESPHLRSRFDAVADQLMVPADPEDLATQLRERVGSNENEV